MDLPDIHRWKRHIESDILAIDGAASIGVRADEIRIVAKSDAAAAEIEAALDTLVADDVPVTVKVAEIRQDAPNDWIRPLEAGTRSAFGNGRCSLGLPFSADGSQWYTTAAHCVDDGCHDPSLGVRLIGQPSDEQADIIGTVERKNDVSTASDGYSESTGDWAAIEVRDGLTVTDEVYGVDGTVVDTESSLSLGTTVTKSGSFGGVSRGDIVEIDYTADYSDEECDVRATELYVADYDSTGGDSGAVVVEESGSDLLPAGGHSGSLQYSDGTTEALFSPAYHVTNKHNDVTWGADDPALSYPNELWDYPEPYITATINLNNQGLSDGDYVDSYIDEHLAPGVRVEIEPGTYNSDGAAFDADLENCEVRGLGEMGDVQFDISGLNSRTDIHAANGSVVIRNITRVGEAENCRHKFSTADDAELTLVRYNHPDGMADGTEDSIYWIPNASSNGPHNNNLVRLLWCHAEHAADNGAYLEAENTPGSLIIVGGLYKDSNISALRFGGLDNTRVYGATVVQTGAAPTHGSSGYNLRGMRVNEDGDGHHIDNCDIYHTASSYTPIEFNDDAAGSSGEMENIRVYTESSASAIEEDGSAASGWDIHDIHVTGPGDLTVEPSASNVCTGSGCDTADPDPWWGDDALQPVETIPFSYTTASGTGSCDISFVLSGSVSVREGDTGDSSRKQVSTDSEDNTVFGSGDIPEGGETDGWELPDNDDIEFLDLTENGGSLATVTLDGTTYTRDEFYDQHVQGMNVGHMEVIASGDNDQSYDVHFLIRDSG